MAVIGTFKLAKDGGWIGSIHTLTLDAKVRFVPNDNRGSDNAPAFRVLTGWSHVGDAWEATSNSDLPKTYLRVRLDDPVFAEPVSAALFPSPDSDQAQLVWNRRPG